MDNRRYTKEEDILVYPLPLMSKGESDLVWLLPSCPKGEIVDIMIQVLSLIIMPTISPFGLDGNNTKSLSPFDTKDKGRTKIFSFLDNHSVDHTPPEYLLKSLKELPL